MLICDDKTGGEWQEVPKKKSSQDFHFTITETHIYLYTIHFGRILALGPVTLQTMIFGCQKSVEDHDELNMAVYLFNNSTEEEPVWIPNILSTYFCPLHNLFLKSRS